MLALVVLIAFFFAMRPDMFLSFTNVHNILYQVAILAIVAGAQTIVMVVGDFDLSVAATAALAGAVAASLMLGGAPVAVAIFAGLVVGLLIGLVNGPLVAYVNLSAFVATLATLTSVTGLAFLVTEGTTLFNLPAEFNNLGQGRFLQIPLPVFIAIGISADPLGRAPIHHSRSPVVRHRRERGGLAPLGRERAARSTSCLHHGGLRLGGRRHPAGRTAGQRGRGAGRGQPAVRGRRRVPRNDGGPVGCRGHPGTMVGVAIIGVMSNGLNILGVNAYVQQVVAGLMMIAAVTLSSLRTRER